MLFMSNGLEIDQDVQHRLGAEIDYVICSGSISFRRDEDSPPHTVGW